MCKQNGKIILRWLGMLKLPVFVAVIIVCLIIIIGFEIVFNDNSLNDDDLIITFFGILATFIVIGQYAQVTEIKHTTETAIESNSKKVDKVFDAVINKNGASKIEEALNNSRKIDEVGQRLSSNFAQMLGPIIKQEVKSQICIQNQLVKYLLTGDHREILKIVILGGEYQCNSVLMKDGTNKENCKVLQKDGKVTVQGIGHCKLQNINQIDGKDFDVEKFNSLLRIYNNYYVSTENNLSAEELAVKQITDNLMYIYKSSNPNNS